MRESQNAYIYDGVYAVDPTLNSFTLSPSVDAVREFKIHTSGTESPFGSNSGGQVIVILKQGQNKFHGSLYEFFRNERLDARNFFDDPGAQKPKLRRNQFGFSAGGALQPGRTFFFGDYEELIERRAITQTTNVPTAQERIGDFSQSLLPAPINIFTGQPFPDARLPYVDPVGAAIAKLYPLPNRNTVGQNFVASPIKRLNSKRFDVRFDQVLAASSRFSGRYSFGGTELFEPYATGSSTLVPGFGNDLQEYGQNLMIATIHAINSNWLNELRFGYNRTDNSTVHQNAGDSLNQTVGLPDFASNQRDLGLTKITVTGFSPLGDEENNPQNSDVESYQILDTVSYTHSAHLVRFGLEQRWVKQDAFRDVLSRGMINFLGAFTQNPLADMLVGLPTYTGGALSNNPQALRTGNTSLFVHENWKLPSDIIFNIGLRYEYNTPAHDAFDRAYIYDPISVASVRVGTNGMPRSGYSSDYNDFAPRLGIAWSPTQNTVIRAGYGIHYNAAPLAPGQGIYFNQPLFQFQLFFPSTQNGPIRLTEPWPTSLQAPLPPSAVTYDRSLRSSYAQHWNIALQGEISDEVIIEVGYHGTSGVHLLAGRDINQATPSTQFPNLRPIPFFQSIDQIETSAHSTYHSIQSQLQCRFRRGLTGQFSYTWAKAIDNASNFFPSATDNNFPQNSYNTSAERGLSSFDVRHRFTGSWVYELPLGKGHRLWGKLHGVLGMLTQGWMLNGVVIMQTGQPSSVILPAELDNSNTGISFIGGAADRPNINGNPVLKNPDPSRWFATDVFTMPTFGSFGTAGRNIVTGPSFKNIDLSLLKVTALNKSAKLQMRLEFFNLFNTPNFHQPNIIFGTPSFGRVLSAHAGREVQLGLKVIF